MHDYLDEIKRKDAAVPGGECTSTKKARKAALAFLFKQCLHQDVNLKSYNTTKSVRQNIRPHQAYNKQNLKTIFEFAKDSPEMNALVHLLYDMAARIQDVVGLTFG